MKKIIPDWVLGMIIMGLLIILIFGTIDLVEGLRHLYTCGAIGDLAWCITVK